MTLTRKLLCGCALLLASCAAQVQGEASDESPAVDVATKALKFDDQCTAEQQSVLTTYSGWLTDYIGDAVLQFQAGPTGERRLYWFGQLDPQQTTTVTERLYGMLDAMFVDRLYGCDYAEQEGCSEGWFAFAPPGALNGMIHVCPRFWDEDNQMRLQILAHEISHLLGTYDLNDFGVYPTCDMARALVLGQTPLHPEWAVVHAQNYACFVMNPAGIPD